MGGTGNTHVSVYVPSERSDAGEDVLTGHFIFDTFNCRKMRFVNCFIYSYFILFYFILLFFLSIRYF